MDDATQEINLGAEVCSRIKRLRYDALPWVDCYKQIADDFTRVKNNARVIYPGQLIIKILANIRSWSDTDLVDVFE